MSNKSYIGIGVEIPKLPKLLPQPKDDADIATIIAYEKSKAEVKLYEDAYAKSLIPQFFRNVSLGEIPKGLPYREQVKKYITNLIPNVRSGRGVLFTGKYGYGKTGAAISIQRAALHKSASTRYVKEQDAIEAIVAPDKVQTDLPEAIWTCDVLVLDELGTTSGNARMYIENLLRTRMEQCLTTLVTTNMLEFEIHGNYPRFGSAYVESFDVIVFDDKTSMNQRTMRDRPRMGT